MRVALLCTPSTEHSAEWVRSSLTARGHDVSRPVRVADVRGAGLQGHDLADTYRDGEAPAVLLALGWEAGLVAQVASRSLDFPVVLRLSRAGREPGSDRFRLETALARSSDLILVPSVGERDRLVECGVGRARLRVLPEALERSRFLDIDAEAGSPGMRVAVALPRGAGDAVARRAVGNACETVAVTLEQPENRLADQLRSCDVLVVADDSEAEVALTLRAMSCAVPVVAVDRGVLSDLVADGVTGLLVRADRLSAGVQALLADPTRRQTMGLAAVDRVRARFTTEVVGEVLERALLEVHPAAPYADRASERAVPEAC